MFWSKLCKSSWNCAWNLAFPVFISPIEWNMCENLPYESVYFKELHNQQEYYWPTIYRTGAAVVSTITSYYHLFWKQAFLQNGSLFPFSPDPSCSIKWRQVTLIVRSSLVLVFRVLGKNCNLFWSSSFYLSVLFFSISSQFKYFFAVLRATFHILLSMMASSSGS